jgi:hypothetical protein
MRLLPSNWRFLEKLRLHTACYIKLGEVSAGHALKSSRAGVSKFSDDGLTAFCAFITVYYLLLLGRP